MMAKDNKTLHLVLKRKWWDMIASGEKKEEYLEVYPYCAKGLLKKQYTLCPYAQNKDYNFDFGSCLDRKLDNSDVYKEFDRVCFHKGFTNTTMTFMIRSIAYRISELCHEEWGAEPNKRYFVIELGERVG